MNGQEQLETAADARPTFLKRVVLWNYRSIASCDVRLGPLTFLVGPNGSGKSNFIDALRFVSDSLQTSLDHALRERGGIGEVRRRSRGHPTHFGMRLDFVIPDSPFTRLSMSLPRHGLLAKLLVKEFVEGHWAFRIGAREQGAYEIQEEQCVLYRTGSREPASYYRVQNGEVASSLQFPLNVARDRLTIFAAGAWPEFRPIFESLSHMSFYNLNPSQMRELQPPDPSERLKRDGSNVAGVLSRLAATSPVAKQRIEEYLGHVVSGVQGVDVARLGPLETLEFRQQIASSGSPWRFLASSMSDGTLRALGVLTALFQGLGSNASTIPLVGIEEPETALHPAAADVLRDALRDASHETQVIVTSHSPDLLDDRSIDPDSLLAVVSDGGATRIGPVDEADRSVLRDHLYTAGELLRLDQLAPANGKRSERPPRLFDPIPT